VSLPAYTVVFGLAARNNGSRSCFAEIDRSAAATADDGATSKAAATAAAIARPRRDMETPLQKVDPDVLRSVRPRIVRVRRGPRAPRSLPAMARVSIDVELAYDRFIADGGELGELERVLREAAPKWSSRLRIQLEPREHEPVDDRSGALGEAIVAAATARGPTYHAMVAEYGGVDERLSGSAEVRGATPGLIVVVGIDEHPFSRIGGALILANDISLQIRRARLERRPASEWALDVFRELCDRTSPAWGSVYDSAEYWAKVMSDGPTIAAVGRDFGRSVPGVFSANFFGGPYVELLGRERLLAAPAEEVVPVDAGILVVRDTAPQAWDGPAREVADERLLDHLGREHFFAKPDPPERPRAPDWPE
jgi:hypothetical protein